MHTALYKDNLADAKEYEKFIVDLFLKGLHYKIDMFETVEEQYRGENKQGIEIKYDRMYKDTGNLWVEIAEKSDKKNINWIASGIFKNDNSYFYLMGNYEDIYIFIKKHLCQMAGSKSIMESNGHTSKGFLLKKEKAISIAARFLKLPMNMEEEFIPQWVDYFKYKESLWQIFFPALSGLKEINEIKKILMEKYNIK